MHMICKVLDAWNPIEWQYWRVEPIWRMNELREIKYMSKMKYLAVRMLWEWRLQPFEHKQQIFPYIEFC